MTLGTGILTHDVKTIPSQPSGVYTHNPELPIGNHISGQASQQSVDREGRSDMGEVEPAPKARQQSNSNPPTNNSNPPQTNLFFRLLFTWSRKNIQQPIHESQVQAYIYKTKNPQTNQGKRTEKLHRRID